jgi:hypothetical protein
MEMSLGRRREGRAVSVGFWIGIVTRFLRAYTQTNGRSVVRKGDRVKEKVKRGTVLRVRNWSWNGLGSLYSNVRG